MKRAFLIPLIAALLCSACANGPKLVRTAPGTSVEVALAKRPQVVKLPAPPPTSIVQVHTKASPSSSSSGGTSAELDKTELVADAFGRGQFCMKTGADEEAISAFREVVKIDPTFAEAWQNLAALYEKSGDEKKAMEAFRNSKSLAKH